MRIYKKTALRKLYINLEVLSLIIVYYKSGLY